MKRLAATVFIAGIVAGQTFNGPLVDRFGVYLILIAGVWILTSIIVTGGWIVFCELARRRARLANRASRPVGDRADRALPLVAAHTYQVRRRDEGTAPADRGAVPEPGEKHPPLRLITSRGSR